MTKYQGSPDPVLDQIVAKLKSGLQLGTNIFQANGQVVPNLPTYQGQVANTIPGTLVPTYSKQMVKLSPTCLLTRGKSPTPSLAPWYQHIPSKWSSCPQLAYLPGASRQHHPWHLGTNIFQANGQVVPNLPTYQGQVA